MISEESQNKAQRMEGQKKLVKKEIIKSIRFSKAEYYIIKQKLPEQE